MAVNRAKVKLHGKRPDEDSWFVAPVVAGWFDNYIDGGNLTKEMAVIGTRVRASWAGDCARAVAYQVAGFEPTDPITVADAWRFNVGTLLHEHIQAAIERAFPGSSSEVKLKLLDVDGSAHLDMEVLRPLGDTGEVWRVAVEIKTINGTGFRRAIELKNPEGVRYKYAYQAALNAAAMDPEPDEMMVAVFSLECLSPPETKKLQIENELNRFAIQFTFSKEEYKALAERETKRLNRIIELCDEGEEGWVNVPRMIPDPEMPKRHKIINPMRGDVEVMDDYGRSQGVGHAWQCDYCPFQSLCMQHIGEGK